MIFSLGVGRAAWARRVRFGSSCLPSTGRQGFVIALTRARRALRIVSCIDPSELDPQKLHHGAVDFYHLLREHAERQAREEVEARHSAYRRLCRVTHSWQPTRLTPRIWATGC